MKIGQKLRELRDAQNLSQGDIEKRTGLLRAYTSRVEHGHVTPSLSTLEKYAAAFDVPLYALCYDGSRRTDLVLKSEATRPRRGAGHNQTPRYELFVKTVAGLNDAQRALLKYVATKLARRGPPFHITSTSAPDFPGGHPSRLRFMRRVGVRRRRVGHPCQEKKARTNGSRLPSFNCLACC
jgi:transcriptional regulator with XRE-family HTH domain